MPIRRNRLDSYILRTIASILLWIFDRTVGNDILSGTYENQSHLAGLSFGYRF